MNENFANILGCKMPENRHKVYDQRVRNLLSETEVQVQIFEAMCVQRTELFREELTFAK